MSIEMEILQRIYDLYASGEFASVYDSELNGMVESPEVLEVMDMLVPLLPEPLEPVEAAERMRLLTDDERNEAISDSGKVLDLRDTFTDKMSENGGALGLVKRYSAAIKVGDTEEASNILGFMEELADRI